MTSKAQVSAINCAVLNHPKWKHYQELHFGAKLFCHGRYRASIVSLYFIKGLFDERQPEFKLKTNCIFPKDKLVT